MMGQTTLRDYLQATEDALSAGRIDDALDHCRLILVQYPHSLEGQRLLGEVYLAQGQLELAQQAFDRVLTNDPENVVTYCSRALISERMQDYDTALDCYQQAYELSRGDSAIRQQFNQLSLKIGQPHFVFSRAGLARLYMRGDLLPQAIQEWETVLSAAPDRLDAQTGLLETYWRENLFDKVEQLARQILDEVPGCLKALLLLAQVTYPHNVRQAQHFIQLAESLDPDLIMAQELFGDAIANQSADPFWTLLRRAPAVITLSHAEPIMAAASVSNGNHSPQATAYADSLVRWDSLDNITEQQPDHQPVQNASSLLSWTGASSGTPVWGDAPEQRAVKDEQDQSWQQRMPPTGDALDEQEEEPAATYALFDDEAPEAEVEPLYVESAAPSDAGQSWNEVESFQEEDFWADQLPATQIEAPASSTVSSERSAPPAWLEMLTSSGWKQPEAYQEVAPDQFQAKEAPELPVSQSLPDFAANVDARSPVEDPGTSGAPFSQAQESTDEEEMSFGPEWLRSLGASLIGEGQPETSGQRDIPPELASMESLFGASDEPSILSQPSVAGDVRVAEPEKEQPFTDHKAQPVTPEPASAVPEAVVEEEKSLPPFSNEGWLSRAVEQLTQPDQNVLTTLEALEHDLRSRGFIPLEPGTLSSIAQEPAPNFPSTPEQTPNRATTRPLEPIAQEAAAAQPMSQKESVEPLWPAAPQPMTTQQASPASEKPEVKPRQAPPAPVPPPMPEFAPVIPPAPPAKLIMPPDQLLDIDLETTMKSPAIRLQPMGKRPPAQSAAAGKERASALSPARSTSGGTGGNKELLLKGYQYQLAGDYDEAMQEYRVIIRNSPELVGEVISNVRALLKISPKFGPGYRVLGDAYMRQGEYLQAMEAYNKALSMTRRAK